MLLHAITVAFSAQATLVALEQERKQDALAKASMTPEQYTAYIDVRFARLKRQQEEQKEERRHQELCSAIRSTSFWRF